LTKQNLGPTAADWTRVCTARMSPGWRQWCGMRQGPGTSTTAQDSTAGPCLLTASEDCGRCVTPTSESHWWQPPSTWTVGFPG